MEKTCNQVLSVSQMANVVRLQLQLQDLKRHLSQMLHVVPHHVCMSRVAFMGTPHLVEAQRHALYHYQSTA